MDVSEVAATRALRRTSSAIVPRRTVTVRDRGAELVRALAPAADGVGDAAAAASVTVVVLVVRVVVVVVGEA
jgi:hypothetical protein